MDNRKELLTITMTREEWDAALSPGSSYAGWDVEGLAYTRLRTLVEEGKGEREAAARAEFEARLPRLSSADKARVGFHVRDLVSQRTNGTLRVDHLGYPDCRVGEFSVSCTPRLHMGDGAAIQLSFAKTPWFKHREAALHPDDRQWFIDLVRQTTGEDGGDVWNERGPYVNVQWWPDRR
jgi:hypothetical protein